MPETTPPSGLEKRALNEGLELRAASAEGPSRVATGYVTPFNSPTNIGDMWTEEFLPGAFTKSLQSRDVIAIHSHETARIVGRKGAGTLTLREDDRGLAFENELPDTTDGRDLAVLIDRGDIAGMSFGFIATVQTWDDTANPPKRTIAEADLYEITYTAIPQYDDTSVGLRSLEGARAEKRQHNKVGAICRISARKARQAHAERGI